MSDLIILSVFSKNMLENPNDRVIRTNITSAEVRKMAPRGATCYVKTAAIAQRIERDLGLSIRYLGTKYLQFSPGTTIIVASETHGGVENLEGGLSYSKVEILSCKPSLVELLFPHSFIHR
jgi:hypothetical protein